MLRAIAIGIGLVLAVGLAGYALFNSEGSVPRSGTGIVTTVTTTPETRSP